MISQRMQGPSMGTESIPQTDSNQTQTSEQTKVDELLAGNSSLNSNAITDQIFYDRHPERRGTSLSKNDPLAGEWKQIKSSVVEPRMSEIKQNNQPATTTQSSNQASSAGSSSVAAETKGIMDMEAGLLQKSLWGNVGSKNAKNEVSIESAKQPITEAPNTTTQNKISDPNFAELNQNPQSIPAGSDVGGANTTRAQELAKVDTSKLTESQKYDHFKGLIEAGGGTFNTTPGARNIVSIRDQDSVDAGVKNSNNEGQGVYNDRMAVLWKDEDGTTHVKEFTGNTEPNRRWANDEHGSQDVNNDQKNDAGRLLPGFYEFKVDKRNGTEDALRPTSDVKVERDLNGDGLYNDNHIDDKAGTSILFHDGKGNNSTGSAGCQTLKKDEWPAFWEAVSQGTNKENIGYTLVQLDETAPAPAATAAE